jgi:D-glycero-D-manno-heptose 1,7-bisphosphate phosphatase
MGIDAVSRRGVFLDRDGVINRAVVRDGKPYPPAGVSELEILPGVDAACHDLHRASFVLILVTNQPDVSRGNQCRQTVESINAVIVNRLAIDDARVCYHDDADQCECRKPKAGLIVQAAQEWQIDLANSFVIGDRWKDIVAGQTAGCKTIFIDYGYAEPPPQSFDLKTDSLRKAADWILRQERE